MAQSELIEPRRTWSRCVCSLRARERPRPSEEQLAARNEDAAALSDLRRRYDEQFVARGTAPEEPQLEGKLEGVYQRDVSSRRSDLEKILDG